MDTSQSRTVASPQLLAEAERLLRSLAGVANARVHASESGIESVHIDVSDPDRADRIAGHVRSALLAGLATPVTPARIHVRVTDTPRRATTTPESGPERAPDTGPETGPRHRLRLLHDDDDTASPRPTPPPDEPVTETPRLVAVDLERPGDGRVLCSVTVAYRTGLHRDDAVAVDLPGAAAQAAAQATVRALTHAGLDHLELDGLREVEIAGRDYVLVALRRADHYTRVRSGSAPITGAPERAAAQATVDAATQLT